MKSCTIIILLLICFFISCKKDPTENPFDQIDRTENTNPDFSNINSDNFAYLHEKVFQPTCANSGCHDGTFEPEFRSISSTYNSLVNHPGISNDAQNSYEKRVVPGSYSESLLNARLTISIPNSSGMMPLEVDSESDWDENASTYISLIQNWITAGAPDMFGNLPGQGTTDFPPTVNGLVVLPEGNTTTPYERDPDQAGITPILVDGAIIDIWILAEDDEVSSENIPVVELKFATSIEELSLSNSMTYSSSETLNALDFSDNNATFYHKLSIDLSPYSSGTILYLRNVLNDGNQIENIEIPNESSSQIITSIFVLQII